MMFKIELINFKLLFIKKILISEKWLKMNFKKNIIINLKQFKLKNLSILIFLILILIILKMIKNQLLLLKFNNFGEIISKNKKKKTLIYKSL